MIYSKFEDIHFQNQAKERLRQIYAVLHFLKSGLSHRQAILRASDCFPQINDYYQTIESKISTQIKVSLDTFFDWYENGIMLSELIPRLKLNEHDRNIFAELLNAEKVTQAPIDNFDSLEIQSIPEEINYKSEKFIEGAATTITINAYERNPKTRKICIKHYGTICYVCNFEFSSKYGSIGQGYIHVHHLKPLSEIKADYQVDPILDLRPVCPNCHAMLHIQEPPLTIEELNEIICKTT